jgi:hypothetical protein
LRWNTQEIPEILTVEEVSYILAELGVPSERTSVGLSLRTIPVEGVIPPRRRGEAWRIPRERLFSVVVVCFFRRKQRSPDRAAWSMELCLENAARRMLRRPELAHLVPDHVKRHVRDLDRRRAREARRRLMEATEAERRRARERREAWDRKRQEERELYERIEREREREAHEKVLAACYSVVFREAYKAIGSPQGPTWTELPEAVQLRRDFPRDRPAWWAPPPGLYEVVRADLPKQVVYGYQEPDWSQWIPPYEPGRAWPWRRPEAEADGAAA